MNDTFEEHRKRLLALGYRMLGSRAEAEDLVQEAWLRWQGVDQHGIDSAAAWLTTTMSRLCIDELRSRKVRQETYVGPWLPEPWFEESANSPEAVAELELADDLSMAFLLLLERLAPEERAAFLLHDIFDLSYTEIASIVDKREDAVRQTIGRARKRVAEERPRFRASVRQQQELASKFQAALALRDPLALASLFKPDAVLISDGGGKVLAALRPIVGAGKIARFFLGITRDVQPGDLRFELRWMNDAISLLAFDVHAQPVIALGFDVRTDGIAGLYAVRNPDKLDALVPASS
jgi:RNA polymerase sigma-70 factor (ECF subfamily)